MSEASIKIVFVYTSVVPNLWYPEVLITLGEISVYSMTYRGYSRKKSVILNEIKCVFHVKRPI
jgi:hypothetical protein